MPRGTRSEAIDRLPNEPYDAGSGIALCSTNLFISPNSFDLAFRLLHTFEATTPRSRHGWMTHHRRSTPRANQSNCV